MIAEELALYLEEKGYGTQEVDLFLGYQPDSPNSCITLYDETAPVLDESQSITEDQFGVQILIRSAEYGQARNNAIAIHKELVGLGGRTLITDGVMINAIYIGSTPTSIGQDNKGRSEWSSHYLLRVESSGDVFRS
jgi:hypothetical protein